MCLHQHFTANRIDILHSLSPDYLYTKQCYRQSLHAHNDTGSTQWEALLKWSVCLNLICSYIVLKMGAGKFLATNTHNWQNLSAWMFITVSKWHAGKSHHPKERKKSKLFVFSTVKPTRDLKQDTSDECRFYILADIVCENLSFQHITPWHLHQIEQVVLVHTNTLGLGRPYPVLWHVIIWKIRKQRLTLLHHWTL